MKMKMCLQYMYVFFPTRNNRVLAYVMDRPIHAHTEHAHNAYTRTS